jgi:hypothetical protein
MRMICRTPVVLALLASLLLLCGNCGGRYGEKRDAAESVTIAGKLSLRGSQPFSVLFLDGEDGKQYVIQSSTLLDELKHLHGMDVMLEGSISSKPHYGVPVLVVKAYKLLALPGGEMPFIGVILVQEDECYLRQDTGASWLIRGEFEGTLASFPGAKVWVIGEKTAGEVPGIQVTGYGMIAPAPTGD